MAGHGGNVNYGGVGRVHDKILLAHVTLDTGPRSERFQQVVRRVLESGKVIDRPRMSVVDKDVGTLHYDYADGYLFVILTANTYPQRTAFKLLEEMRQEVNTLCGPQLPTAKENGLTSARRLIQQLCERYDDLSSVDKVTRVTQKVEEVKGVMNENITRVMQNTEALETLEDKSAELRNQSSTFQKQSTSLKRAMCQRNVKLTLIIVCVLILLLVIIIVPIVAKT